MQNNLQLPIPRLLTLGEDVANGYDLHGVGIGITRNTGAMIRVDIGAAETARDNYDTAAQAVRDRNGELQALSKEAYEFALFAKNLWRPVLGKKYSESWNQTGLTASLEVPTNHEDLQALMQSMRTFLTNHAALESATHNITAAQAEVLRAAISDKRAELQTAEGARQTAMNLRNAAMLALRTRLRLFIQETAEKIGPLDPKWVSLGLNMPGKRATPDVPQNLAVILSGAGGISVKWDRAARADYYRIWARIAGTETEFGIVGTSADLDFTLLGLPSNTSMEIAVSAMNNGGESARSAVLVVVTA